MLKTCSLRNGVYQKVRLLLMRTYRQIISGICIIAITLALSIAPATASKTPPQEKNIIIVGGEIGYPPYSFLNEKGEPTGLSVELTRAIAKTMGINIEIRLTPWTEARNALENSTIDIIPGMFYSEERARIFDFSPPFSIVSTAIFARIHSPSVESIEDTRDREIIVMRGEAMHDYILKHRLTDRILLTETPADALRLLASGKGDYALVAQMPGFYWIKELKLSNIMSVGPSLEPFENCFAVRKGNNLLLSSFTEGLSIINQTGEYQKISEKWLGVLMPTRINTGLMIKYAAIVLIPLILLLALSFLWSWMLRSRVNIKTKELLESEEKYRLMAENMSDVISVMDINFRFSYVSPSITRLTGFSVEEALQHSIEDIMTPDSYKEILKIMEEEITVEASGKNDPSRSRIIEYQQYTKDRSIVWVESNCRFLRDRDQKLGGILIISRDITERKQVEKEMQRQSTLIISLMDSIPDIIFIKDIHGVYLGCNAEFARHVGRHKEDVPGKTDYDLYSKDEADFFKENDKRMLELGKPRHNEEWISYPDNRKLLLDTLKTPYRGIDGNIIGVIGICRDITDRKRMEIELKDERDQLLSLFNSIDEAIYIADLDTNELLYVNSYLENLLSKDCIGAKCYKALQGLNAPCSFCTNDIIREQKPEPHRWEYYNPSFDRHYTIIDRVIRWSDGRDVRFEMAIDISAIKKAVSEKEKIQTQLNQAQKMESVGRLAGGVAHDFNNMLGVILGHTELALLKTDEDNDLVSDLNEIQKAAKRSADITKQLLAFARKQTISPRQLDLNDTVEKMLTILRRLIGEDIDLVWQPGANLWSVKMDPIQIDQILANLCINARDAIADVGKLTIETGKKTFDEEYCKEHPGFIPGDFVLLAVSDNGCGMDKEILENLFEPFFTTKEVGKGTGLGLATIYGIVKQNHGFINVYSEPGQGSTFKIYLPRLVADEDAEKAVSEKKAAAGGTETILLVEDEPTILRMTWMMLERKGYSVISAATPAEAVEKATNHSGSIDLLMTDVVMPDMNGRDLAGQITAIYPGIGLLYMSGYTSNVIAHHGVLDAGVAFVQKPFSMSDMTAKVREVLDKASDETNGDEGSRLKNP
jgi:PAS domain S-box-containing protein